MPKLIAIAIIVAAGATLVMALKNNKISKHTKSNDMDMKAVFNNCLHYCLCGFYMTH